MSGGTLSWVGWGWGGGALLVYPRPSHSVHHSELQVLQAPVFLKIHHHMDSIHVVGVQDVTCLSQFPVPIDCVSL